MFDSQIQFDDQLQERLESIYTEMEALEKTFEDYVHDPGLIKTDKDDFYDLIKYDYDHAYSKFLKVKCNFERYRCERMKRMMELLANI